MRHRRDICLSMMKSQGETMTADACCLRNYGMDYEDLRDGEFPEWLAEVQALISDGELFVEVGRGEFTLAISEEAR